MQFIRTSLTVIFVTCAFFGFTSSAFAATYVGGSVTSDATWYKANSPYIITSPLGVATGVTLTIEPGVVVKMGQPDCNCYANIGISGKIVAGEVSSSDRVVFTSVLDDSVGGDSNEDNTATTPAAGDWRMIAITGGTLELHHADVRYGGLALRPFTFFNPDAYRMLDNQGGEVIFDDADISYAYGNASYRQLYTGTTTVSNSFFHDSPVATEFYAGGAQTITGTKFATTAIAVYFHSGTLTVSGSSFNNTTYGVYNVSPTDQVDARNNFWGSASGPTNPANPTGTGAISQGNVIFDPWTGLGCVTECYSNVLFLPGIMGSRLFEQSSDCGVLNNEKERWVSMFDCDHAHLALDSQGKSVYPLYTKEGPLGVVDDTYSSNIYQSFMSDLAGWKSDGTINDYALVPYDWRLSLEDILQNGSSSTGQLSYSASQGFQSAFIYKKLNELSDSSKTKKVTIIAHSNGGLVTKALIQKLKDTHDPLYERIDKVIFVAVPQSGTPEVIGSLLHGSDIGPGGLVIAASRVRDLVHNMPFAYAQVPTEKYVGSGIPLIEFRGFSATSSFGKYGTSIDTIAGLHDYLNGGDGRTAPSYADLLHAQIANAGQLAAAHDIHAVLDNWTPATSTEVYEIAGWGLYTSMGLRYEPNKICVVSTTTIPVQPGAPQAASCAYYEDSYKISNKLGIDGDGTVMRRSAHQIAVSSTTHQFWLDLAKYDDDNIINRNHKDIFEVTALSGFLKTVVIGAPQVNDYITDSIFGLSTVQKPVKYEVHSPLSLSIYDSKGHHTGVSTTTGLVELGVKGSSYYEIGDSKIILVDASISHTMKLDAYGSGSFTLDIEELDGDNVIASTSFMGIPTTSTTKASLDWHSGEEIGTSTKLFIDFNDDNVIDAALTAKAGEIVLFTAPDFTPPTTTASTTGILGTNGWYTSNAIVSLTATDTESGVASTTYSLDSGASWTTYTSPFSTTIEGTTTVLYYSVDKAGNSEATNTLLFKIDKTAPEASISISTSTQDILVVGVENLGTTTVLKDSIGNVILTDQAGHTTKLFFTKTYSGKQLTYAKLTGVQYDSQPKMTIPSSSFLYIWDNKIPMTLLSQTIAVDGTYLIQATYEKIKNKTTIIVLKKSLPIQTQVFAGLKVVKLTTNKGAVGYSW